ncbi:hypothetical protein R1sor_007761 [Riccia sorocarpa]|uniref:Uncharacterized protein n=1 Tax=Riccia sorocarpa TaxID=122646 RepID=A0ABD3HRD9_9MARC
MTAGTYRRTVEDTEEANTHHVAMFGEIHDIHKDDLSEEDEMPDIEEMDVLANFIESHFLRLKMGQLLKAADPALVYRELICFKRTQLHFCTRGQGSASYRLYFCL